MKFHSKLIAGAGAVMLFASGANAAVLTGTTTSFSKQGINTTGNITLPVAPGVVNVLLAADYSLGDTIKLTITGATLASGSSLTTKMVCPNGANPPPLVVGNPLSVDTATGVITMRVTQKNVVSTIGAACEITGIQVTRASMAAGTGAKLGYSAFADTSGIQIDTGCATAPVGGNAALPGTLVACASGTTPNTFTLTKVVSQFSAALSKDVDGNVIKKFDGVIDVETDREEFVGRDWDWYEFTIQNNGLLAESVTGVSATVTLKGNFSFNAGADGKCGTADDEGALISNTTVAYATDCQSIDVTAPVMPDGVLTGATLWVEVVVPGLGSGIQLEPQSFATDATFKYSTTKSELITFDSGAWTINGALVYVPYMPYSTTTSISRIVYVANKGAQTGAISISAFDNAGKTYKFDGGVATSKTVTELSGILDNGLKNAGFSGNGKVAFVITVVAPAQDIDVYSAYNVGGNDRGTVVNSHNGGR